MKKAQSLTSSMHLCETRERSSTMLLKLRAFLLFHMLQAMAVLMVDSSKLWKHESKKSVKLA
jgi:hypothetical protein